MQGLKPSVLMRKLKQNLHPGVSPDNYLFLAIFLVRLPPSMRETVGAGNHMTATAMVKAADVLWDARGGYNPMVAAATTQRSRSPAPNIGRRGDKQGCNGRFKSRPTSRPEFHSFQNPGNGVCKLLLQQGSQECSTLCLVGKLVCHRTIFGLVANPAHATAMAMHFSANAGLIFLTDELTKTGIWLILWQP